MASEADNVSGDELNRLLSDVPSDISVDAVPCNTQGLRFYPLYGQDVHDKIEIRRYTFGLVADGLEAYLEERRIETHDVPSTYSKWDDEFANATHGRQDSAVLEGPVGEARDSDEACRYCWRSDYVRAGVRILDGGGRFDAAEYDFHEAVPFGVLGGSNIAVTIAPLYQQLDEDDIEEPDFTYSSEGGSDDFCLVRGGDDGGH